MRPNFKDIDIKSAVAECHAAPASVKNEADWMTAELIPVKSVYTEEDLQGLEHLDFVSGIPPYLRGPYSAMYPLRPWTIRHTGGLSRGEEDTLRCKGL